MNGKKIEEIEDTLEDFMRLINDVRKELRSIFTVVITLFLSTWIFRTKFPVVTCNFISTISFLILLWGFICMINLIMFGPLILLENKIDKLGSFLSSTLGEIIIRMLFVGSIIVPTLNVPSEVLRIGGVIGFVLCIAIYIVTGHWRVFPGEMLLYPDWEQTRLTKIVYRDLHDPGEPPDTRIR